MAEFYLYMDESGKLGNSAYTSLCGYVTHAREWDRISLEWDSARLSWGVPPLHMSCIKYPDRDKTGEWTAVAQRVGKDWDAMRDRMLDDFGRILHQSHAVCVGAAVDAEYYDNMPKTKFKNDTRNPLYLSFLHVIETTLDKLDNFRSGSYQMSIIIDDDQEYSLNCYRLIEQLRKILPDKIGKRIDAITFGNDRAYPGLQAADMIAYETRSILIERKNGTRAEVSPLFGRLTKGLIHQPVIYTAEKLDEVAAEWK